MAATGIEEVLQSLMDTLGLCAEKIKGSHGIFTLQHPNFFVKLLR